MGNFFGHFHEHKKKLPILLQNKINNEAANNGAYPILTTKTSGLASITTSTTAIGNVSMDDIAKNIKFHKKAVSSPTLTLGSPAGLALPLATKSNNTVTTQKTGLTSSGNKITTTTSNTLTASGGTVLSTSTTPISN
jgi:hypothetical protein